MVFAGALFEEWYWAPIFLLVYTSPAMAVAFVVTAVVLGRRTGWGPAARIVAAAACALAVPALLALVMGMKGPL